MSLHANWTAVTSKWFGLALLASASLVACPLSTHAATLHVDEGDPNCNNSGSGTAEVPFCTITAAHSEVVAGDTVLVHPGVYNERVRITKSGTSSSPITFMAESGVTVSGQSNGFDLSGANWVTVEGFNVSNTTSHAVRIALASNLTLEDCTISNAGSRGIYMTDSSDITISGNDVLNSTSYGMDIRSSTLLTVADNLVSGSGEPFQGQIAKGVYVNGVSDSVFADNVFEANTDSGIYLINGTTGVIIRDNVATENARGYTRAAPGIDIRDSSGNTVQSNIAFENEDTGIQLYSGGSSNLVVNNLTYNNGDHGIDANRAPNNRIIGNTVYGSVTSGINVEVESFGATIVNNIASDNGINSPRQPGNIRVDDESVAGTVADYNLVYLSETAGQETYKWNDDEFATLDELHVEYPGVEVNGIEDNPQFVGPETADFHLQGRSVAIDSANSGASGALSVDLEGQARVDDLGMPNTGAGSRDYDDRGAFEFQGESVQNTAPVIVSGPMASPNPVSFTETAELSVEATDAEDDPLEYTWVVPQGGGSVSGSGASVTYTPPAVTAPETFNVAVSVTDGFGGLTQDDVDVDVILPPGEQIVTVRPEADTFARENSPDTTFGTASKIEVDGNQVEVIYLRFNVAGVATVTSARLQLEVINASIDGGAVHTISDNTWQETTLTYNNRPAVDGPSVGELGIVTVSQIVEIDLTSVITGNGTYNFAIVSDDSDGAGYRSREGSAETPLLVITSDES